MRPLISPQISGKSLTSRPRRALSVRAPGSEKRFQVA
jgi:hypothetical protein